MASRNKSRAPKYPKLNTQIELSDIPEDSVASSITRSFGGRTPTSFELRMEKLSQSSGSQKSKGSGRRSVKFSPQVALRTDLREDDASSSYKSVKSKSSFRRDFEIDLDGMKGTSLRSELLSRRSGPSLRSEKSSRSQIDMELSIPQDLNDDISVLKNPDVGSEMDTSTEVDDAAGASIKLLCNKMVSEYDVATQDFKDLVLVLITVTKDIAIANGIKETLKPPPFFNSLMLKASFTVQDLTYLMIFLHIQGCWLLYLCMYHNTAKTNNILSFEDVLAIYNEKHNPIDDLRELRTMCALCYWYARRTHSGHLITLERNHWLDSEGNRLTIKTKKEKKKEKAKKNVRLVMGTWKGVLPKPDVKPSKLPSTYKKSSNSAHSMTFGILPEDQGTPLTHADI